MKRNHRLGYIRILKNNLQLFIYSSCSTSGTRRVNLVTNPVISHEWGKDREVFTTSGTYPWSFVTQIFHSGQPSHGGDRKSDDFNLTKNHKLWNIASTERYIPRMQVLLECCYIWKECSQWENWIISFVVSFLTSNHCYLLGVWQGMKQT